MKKVILTSKWVGTLILILALTLFSTESVFAAANAVSSAAGSNHSLILKSDGTVWAWGNNDGGKLGDGTTAQRGVPVQVKGLTSVTRIAAGISHSLALKSDGTVWAWGNNKYGQIGNTQSSTPVQVSGLTDVATIAAGGNHNLALKKDGTVWAWGYNYSGQLGDGSYGNGANKYIPVKVSGLTDIIAIASGNEHSLAVKKDGTVWAWGYNGNGQLGINSTSNSSTPIKVNNLVNITGIAAGSVHSLALDVDGKVYAWGYNGDAGLGDGTYTNRLVPVQVINLADIVEIASGSSSGHSLALKKDGSVYVWGYNNSGQIGNGTTNNATSPQLITNTQK